MPKWIKTETYEGPERRKYKPLRIANMPNFPTDEEIWCDFREARRKAKLREKHEKNIDHHPETPEA